MTRAKRSHAERELAQGLARTATKNSEAACGMTRAKRSHAERELAQGLARTATKNSEAAA